MRMEREMIMDRKTRNLTRAECAEIRRLVADLYTCRIRVDVGFRTKTGNDSDPETANSLMWHEDSDLGNIDTLHSLAGKAVEVDGDGEIVLDLYVYSVHSDPDLCQLLENLDAIITPTEIRVECQVIELDAVIYGKGGE